MQLGCPAHSGPTRLGNSFSRLLPRAQRPIERGIPMIRLSKIAFASAVFVAAIGFIVVQKAAAGTFKVTGSFSGTGFTVPIDLDGDGTTCTTVGSVTTCPDDSFSSTYVSQAIGIFGGTYTGQNVNESVPVSGTGCFIAPATIQSCTLGAVTNACAFQYLAGGTGANIRSATRSVETYAITSGTICLDFSSGLPFNFAGSQSFSLTGGTGEFKGVTGSGIVTFTGQETSADPANHGFSWFTATFTETLIK
jgi:hypothetical protein